MSVLTANWNLTRNISAKTCHRVLRSAKQKLITRLEELTASSLLMGFEHLKSLDVSIREITKRSPICCRTAFQSRHSARRAIVNALYVSLTLEPSICAQISNRKLGRGFRGTLDFLLLPCLVREFKSKQISLEPSRAQITRID
jgi:hypothetical protein